MADSELMERLLKAIDILEQLENLIDDAPTPEVEQILQEAWLKVSRTLPEDFNDATHLDAGAEGLRRYLKVRAFFHNPTQYPISREDLEIYYRHQLPPVDDSAEFFFPE
jgi:hypothetical protein